MRASQFIIPTLRETPADAEIISHQLMLRAGMIRKVASGIYTWLPLGLRVLRKVEQIVREEMNRSGAQELLLPAVQPADLWKESGRWQQYGPELLRFQDRHEHDFCFGPTHEEIISYIARNDLRSYKQLPLNLYQIQTKFRDEIRPRFGVMRSREFIMKDAYSFHIDKSSLHATYQVMHETYSNIFSRLGLKFRAVLADTGNIGGNYSHEFHVLAETGEDLIAYSDQSDYAANIEIAEAIALPSLLPAATATRNKVTTPGLFSVADQTRHLNIPTHQMMKTLLVKGREHPVVALLLRGDHELNAIKAQKHPWIASPLTLVTDAELKELNLPRGFIGPIDCPFPIIADRSAATMNDFVCGANELNNHWSHVQWERDLPVPEIFDLRLVQEGDPSPDGQGTLKMARGIEVGHIFQLGDKYSKAMNIQVLDDLGQRITVQMGCYGVGVTRIVGAAIEQNHDGKGIIWPTPIAPFQVALVALNSEHAPEVRDIADQLYDHLTAHGFEVLYDDRDERAGVKFSDMDLIGIPHRIVISERSLKERTIEYKARTQAAAVSISLDDPVNILLRIQNFISEMAE